jgi:hypothetical protein
VDGIVRRFGEDGVERLDGHVDGERAGDAGKADCQPDKGCRPTLRKAAAADGSNITSAVLDRTAANAMM